MVSVSIEFDASSFKTRVRKGMIVADAKYHVLATLTKLHDSDRSPNISLNVIQIKTDYVNHKSIESF